MFTLIVLLPQQQLHASQATIARFLQAVKERSEEMKATHDELRATMLEIDASLAIFNTGGYLQGSYANEETPPRSPFSPDSSTVKELGGGVSKLWNSGITSQFTYTLTDSVTAFPSRSDFVFTSPRLELSASTSLLQNLLFERYDHMIKRMKERREEASLSAKIDKKAVLVKSLLDFSNLLEQQEMLSLQVTLCKKTKNQAENLKRKRKRGTVSKRNYFLSLKELRNCQASIDQIKSTVIALEENFKADYGMDFTRYRSLEINELFTEAKTMYQQYREKRGQVDLDGQDDIQKILVQVKGLEHYQDELNAQAQTNLSLEVRSGLTGLDNSVAAGHEDITQAEYPFVYIGLTMDLPLKNREALQRAGANRYLLSALKRRKELAVKRKGARLETLEKTLEKDFVIYRQYERAVELSQNIVKEARRDFNNGRLDLNILTDFTKSLIQDQRTLSGHRIQLIVKVVEYLDFYQYFDRYL